MIQNAKNKEVKKNGRPSKTALIDKEMVKKLILKGFTDKEISNFFSITEQTFNNWKKNDPKFFESLKDWKVEADQVVEKSLYQRAKGFEYSEVCTENMVIDGKEVKGAFKKKTTTKQVPPDPTSCIFWLKNRQPEQWREKVEHEHTGSLTVKYGHRKECKPQSQS